MAKSRPIEQRFWEKVEKTDNCWVWSASKDKKGYGRILINYKVIRAHRWSYEQAKGKIPEKLTIDHLCRNRACVNPDHLEAVTNEENLKRSPLWGGKKIYCKFGHKFTKESTYFDKRKYRVCKFCRRKSEKKYREKIKLCQ